MQLQTSPESHNSNDGSRGHVTSTVTNFSQQNASELSVDPEVIDPLLLQTALLASGSAVKKLRSERKHPPKWQHCELTTRTEKRQELFGPKLKIQKEI